MVRIMLSITILLLSTHVSANPMFLQHALAEYGTTEKDDPKQVLKYANICGLAFNSTSIPWCGSFVCYIVHKAGMKSIVPANPGLARQWAKVGEPTIDPVPGDIVVFWRNGLQSGQGHVGFFVKYSKDGKHIYVLGGNQANRVSISKYPTYRLITIRRVK